MVFKTSNVPVLKMMFWAALIFVQVTSFESKAQSNKQIDKIYTQISSNLRVDFDKLNDSIEVYGFSIVVKFDKKQLVTSVTINDTTGKSILKNYGSLKTIDFKTVINDPQMQTLVVPVIALRKMYEGEKSTSKIYISQFNRLLTNIFDIQAQSDMFEGGKAFTKPFVIYLDKTVYDEN